ncbi:hypothetical protein [Candidatus Enterococcus leclercqii]|uniref:hypothetical protein n=1 Tax=Candidatus Enterococcus leclercqii TaxID=1857218 RepID=UPI00137A2FD3|nr:hypothetical protein [Enterococcus sp. CU9D]KAF1294211.1 hypothetical protein BAU14_07430 [Enterococcus sp. CU9D]
MDEKRQKRLLRKKMLAIMGNDDTWKDCEEKVEQVHQCIAMMEYITSRPSNGKERQVKVLYPDGLVGKVRSITEAAIQFDCSITTIERSLKTGKPVKRGLAKGMVFQVI